MNIEKETLDEIIRLAFDMGESWGTTYQGWFTPSEHEKELKVIDAINLCLGELE
jgi:hypothetical protein